MYRTKLERKKYGKELYWVPSYENKVEGFDPPTNIFSSISTKESTTINGIIYKIAMFKDMREASMFLEKWLSDKPEYDTPGEFTEEAF